MALTKAQKIGLEVKGMLTNAIVEAGILEGFEVGTVRDVVRTGDAAFAVRIEIEGEARVINFVGTLKKNEVDGVAVVAEDVIDQLVTEYNEKVADRDSKEIEAKIKVAAKLAKVEAKKVKGKE